MFENEPGSVYISMRHIPRAKEIEQEYILILDEDLIKGDLILFDDTSICIYYA